MITDHALLALEAERLRKACYMAVALGLGDERIREVSIPAYLGYPIQQLQQHSEGLRSLLAGLGIDKERILNPSAVAWLADAFDMWAATEFAIFDLGRLVDIEAQIGELVHGRVMDCPAYAHVILQGFHVGAGIRFPEYHLATDLRLMMNLYLDCQDMMKVDLSLTDEPNQSLGRSVILTCFNLLEAFTSGLVAEYLIKNLNADSDIVRELEDKNAALSRRFSRVPGLVRGDRLFLDLQQPPLAKLFGEIKWRRDSFVHCEPGSAPTKRGYVKEAFFHEIGAPLVSETVDLTLDAITLAWNRATGKKRPSWLPSYQKDGRLGHREVSLSRWKS